MNTPPKRKQTKPSVTFFNAGIFFFIVIWTPSVFFVENIYIKAGTFIIACIVAAFFLGLSWVVISEDWDDDLIQRADEALAERDKQKNKKEDE